MTEEWEVDSNHLHSYLHETTNPNCELLGDITVKEEQGDSKCDEGNKFFHCHCGSRFSRQDFFDAHQNVHSLRVNCQSVKCPVCETLLEGVESYADHNCHRKKTTTKSRSLKSTSKKGSVKNRRPVDPNMCRVCEKVFTHSVLLLEHKLSHPELRQLTCRTCGADFENELELIKHLGKGHEGGSGDSSRPAEEKSDIQLPRSSLRKRSSHSVARKSTISRALQEQEAKGKEDDTSRPKRRCASQSLMQQKNDDSSSGTNSESESEGNDSVPTSDSEVESDELDENDSSPEDFEHRKERRRKRSKNGTAARQLHGKKDEADDEETSKSQAIFTCDLCQEEFDMRKPWILHMMKHPENDGIVCEYCGKKCGTPDELEQHKNELHGIHEAKRRGENVGPPKKPVELSVCHLCGKTVRKKGERAHMISVHYMEIEDAPTFPCDDCGKVFPTLPRLESHKMSHTGLRPFKCPFCPREYGQKQAVLRHAGTTHFDANGYFEVDVDDEEKPFICDQCGWAYTTEVGLTMHMKTHGEEEYQCPRCPVKFFTEYELFAHKMKHNVLRRNHDKAAKKGTGYRCDYCAIKYRRQRDYAKHMYEFHGEDKRLYSCAPCGRTFYTKSDLKYHEQSKHNEAFKFSCEVCGKGADSRGNLNHHMRLHGGGFKCPFCHRRHMSFQLMQEHAEEEHGETISKDKWVRHGYSENGYEEEMRKEPQNASVGS